MVRNGYGTKWQWYEMVMVRNGYGTKMIFTMVRNGKYEMVMVRNDCISFSPILDVLQLYMLSGLFNDLITAILDVFRKSNIYGPKGKKNQNYQNMRFANIYR